MVCSGFESRDVICCTDACMHAQTDHVNRATSHKGLFLCIKTTHFMHVGTSHISGTHVFLMLASPNNTLRMFAYIIWWN